MTFPSALQSFFLGVLVSLLLWFVNSKVFVPRLKWSKEIACEVDDNLPGQLKQSIKIKNVGWRTVIDVKIVCILHVPTKESVDKTFVCELPTMGVPLPRLPRGETRTITMKTYGIDREETFSFPKATLETMNQEPPRSLRELLSSEQGAEIQVHISAYDKFSGTRKSFLGKPYTVSKLANGHFAWKSLEFIPD